MNQVKARTRWASMALICCCMLMVGSAQAAALSFEQALATMLDKQPDLKISDLQIKIKAAEGQGLEGALDPRYGASLGLSDEQSPTTSPFAPTGTTATFLSGQVNKPFADGSQLTASLSYNRAELAYPGSVAPAFQSKPNPVFTHQIDLLYRYPLANGAGNPNYTYQKQANASEMKVARLNVLMLREQMANQLIGAYFQLMLDDLSVQLAKDAKQRAKGLLAYQMQRESFGLIEKADRLQTDALVAGRDLQYTQALAARDFSRTQLNRLLLQPAEREIVPVAGNVEVAEASMQEMMAIAEVNRPVFQMLDAQFAAAESRLRMAERADEYQLDLVGQIGSRALESGAGSAFAQGFTLDDRFVGLRVEFSDSWGHSAGRAAVQRNVLALESIKLERQKMHETIQTELASVREMMRSGRITLAALKQQAVVEKKKFEAEMVRYREGRSSTATVIQFEGDLRTAELRALIQELALMQSGYRLLLTLGELPALQHWAVMDVVAQGVEE